MTSKRSPDPATAGVGQGARRLTEFGLIAKYLAPLAAHPGARGLIDDVAVLRGQDLAGDMILNTDTVVAGVHFLPDDPPDAVAERVLRVNLSDLAAKGAKPLGYLLTLALGPAEDEAWIAGFTEGLGRQPGCLRLVAAWWRHGPDAGCADDQRYGRRRSTAREGANAGRRAGRRPGLGVRHDRRWRVGPGCNSGGGAGYRAGLGRRGRRPLPPAGAAGRAWPGVGRTGQVSASADISDGLVADLGHIADASGLGAVIEGPRVPLSRAGQAAVAGNPDWFGRLITGGDDYELLLTAPPGAAAELAAAARGCGVALTCIGRMEAGSGVTVLNRDGQALVLGQAGYRHF